MGQVIYFLDTYALIELIKKNKNYKKFEDTINFTNLMNLLEIHYLISRDFGPMKADEITHKLSKLVIDIELNDVEKASKFRTKNVSKKFSYIDCLGYSMAFNREIKFLTGDKEFEGMENVEFVK